MKSRTTWKAALRGRPLEWTSDALDEARTETNESPPAPGKPSSNDRWEARDPITAELRGAFQATVFIEQQAEREARGLPAGAPLEPRLEAEIKRNAFRRALVAHGLPKIRRRRIPLPKKLLKRARIS